jgi:hypothetical protein
MPRGSRSNARARYGRRRRAVLPPYPPIPNGIRMHGMFRVLEERGARKGIRVSMENPGGKIRLLQNSRRIPAARGTTAARQRSLRAAVASRPVQCPTATVSTR